MIMEVLIPEVEVVVPLVQMAPGVPEEMLQVLLVVTEVPVTQVLVALAEQVVTKQMVLMEVVVQNSIYLTVPAVAQVVEELMQLTVTMHLEHLEVTVPVAPALTVAVKVTLWPTCDGLGVALRVVLEAAGVTVWARAAEVALPKLPSPP